MRKTLAIIVLCSLTLLLSACGSGHSSAPPPASNPQVHVVMGTHTLSVPSSSNNELVENRLNGATAPDHTTMSISATNINSDITVNITDQHDNGDSLILDQSSCKLTPTHSTCSIRVSSTAKDKKTDRLTIDATDADSKIDVDNSTENITFQTPTPPQAHFTMPYRTLNVDQDYVGQHMPQVITALSYLGGNSIAGQTLTVTNKSGINLTLDQKDWADSSSKNTTITLSNNATATLPNSQWTLQDTNAKNTYMLITSNSSSVPFCTAANSNAGIYYDEGKDLKVPRTNSSLTLYSANNIPSGKTQCDFEQNKIPSTQSITISDPSNQFQDLLTADKYGNINLQKNISLDIFHQLKNYCPQYANDPNQLVCAVTLSLSNKSGSHTAKLPILVNNGLRAKSIPTLVNEYIDATTGTIKPEGRDYFEISTKPENLSSDTKMVDLNEYFTDPSNSKPAANNITYTLDATNVGGNADEPIAYITGINLVAYQSNNQYFHIKDGALYGKGTLPQGTPPPGIYQINVKAAKGAEIAYATFYVDVNENTTSLSAWQQGGAGSAATTNVLSLNNQPLTMIYSYSHADPSKSSDNFNKVYKGYSDNVHFINTQFLTKNNKSPINSIGVEFSGPSYPANSGYWKVDNSQTDIKKQIVSSAVQNGFTDLSWMPALIKTIQKNGNTLTLSPDLTFGQSIRASYANFNAEQLQIVSQYIMKYVPNQKGSAKIGVSGISFDLEKGTGNSDAKAFKIFADHLAYKGLFFGYYEFADKSFQPSIVAAMGPLGVAFVSSYDAGTDRAKSTDYNYSVAASGDGIYSKIFANNYSCNIHKVGDTPDPMKRASWCNLSTNDSLTANKIAWNESTNRHHLTTYQTINMLNGNYSITLPTGESSTDFSYLELFNPDLSQLVKDQTGLVMTHLGNCSMLTQKNPADWTDVNLDACLFADANSTINGKSFSTYSHCGKDIPYTKCILVSSNLSAIDGVLKNPTQADYIKENIKAYDTNDSHMVGYSLFALQDTASAPGGGNMMSGTKTNLAIQQPWYIGGAALMSPGSTTASICNPTSSEPCDPFYGSDISKKIIADVWNAFAEIQKNANAH